MASTAKVTKIRRGSKKDKLERKRSVKTQAKFRKLEKEGKFVIE